MTVAHRNFNFSIPKCSNIQTRQSTTQHLFLYTMVYMSGQHVSTQQVILRPSKKTDPRVVQFPCIVGYQKLTGFCYRNIKYVSLYKLNLCGEFSLIIRNLSDMAVYCLIIRNLSDMAVYCHIQLNNQKLIGHGSILSYLA